jgi:MFS family permease
MDLAFEATGQLGKFQKILISIVIFLPMTALIVNAGFPIFTAKPVIFCREKDDFSNKLEKCFLEDICLSPKKYEIKKVPEKSIKNWVYEYDLICQETYKAPLIGTSFFTGAIIGSMFLAQYPDKVGRLTVFKILLLANIFIHLNLLFAQSIEHILFLALLAGITSYISSVLSLLITEFIHRNISGLIMSLRSASFGIVGVLISCFFMTVNNLKILFIITSIIAITIFIVVHIYFVESPRWLNSKNRMLEAIEAFEKLSIINNTHKNFLYFLESNREMIQNSANEIKKIEKTHNLIDIFFYKSQKKKMLVLMYLWFAITFSFYGLFINLERKEGNIFIDTIITYTAEVIAELFSGFCANIFGRVFMIKYLSFAGGIGFLLNFLINSRTIQPFLIFVSSFGFSGALNILYIYTPESFPTSIRAKTFGFLFLISRAAAVVVPVVSNISRHMPLFIAILSSLGGWMTCFLEETLGREMVDDIPELQRKYSVLSFSKKSLKSINKISSTNLIRETIVSDIYFKVSFKKQQS